MQTEYIPPSQESQHGPSSPNGGNKGPEHKKAPLSKRSRTFWTVVAIVSGIGFALDLLPTPEDAIPILGWLDEGMLGSIFLFSLNKLGVEIPILSRFVGKKKK